MVMEDRGLINKITKELYPKVAAAFDTSDTKVERAIRHAIEVAWTRGRIENINQLFDTLGIDGPFCHSIASFRLAGRMRAIISSHRRLACRRIQLPERSVRTEQPVMVPAIISRKASACTNSKSRSSASCARNFSSLVSYSQILVIAIPNGKEKPPGSVKYCVFVSFS